MRTILNISVPAEVAAEAKRAAKADGFASVSEFFRYLLREEKRRNLARSLRQQDKKGEWKKLHSLRDLR